MIPRPEYLNTLISFKDTDLIKVVTGIRRCGKSTLFDLYSDYLKENGIEEEQIFRLNLEEPEFSFLNDSMKLYNYVKEKLNPKKKNYVFIDEVQNVPKFQKALDGLFLKKYVDLYITGSNAYLLSGELATLLSGRYVEISMLPLSFKEYISVQDDKNNLERLYLNYITKSSFPLTLSLKTDSEVERYLKSIFDSIVLKDIIARKKFPNLLMLQSVINFLLDNIGNITSTKKIADTMSSSSRNISVHTVENYITALTESFIFYKASRYDIKGKQYLKTMDKYYVADPGLRHYLLGKKQGDRGHILENVIYLELKRRGYDIYIGKVDEKEIDFVATNSDSIEYYQVALTVRETKTLERELAPFYRIKDNFPKYLLTLDIDPKTTHDGIIQMNALDWLLDKK